MKRNREAIKLIKTLIIVLIAVAFVLPFAWMVTSSLKQTREVFSPDWQWHLKNSSGKTMSRFGLTRMSVCCRPSATQPSSPLSVRLCS